MEKEIEFWGKSIERRRRRMSFLIIQKFVAKRRL
jgi:hypothetical protein